jgi:surfeit locus 1 family protein
MADPPRGRFRPGVAATLATLGALTVLMALGVWQLRRMEWKQVLIARIESQLRAPVIELQQLPSDPTGLDWRRVRIRTELLEDRSFAWGAAALGGEPAAHVLTPARLQDGGLVLIDRGVVAERDLPPHMPDAMRAHGPVTIEGVARLLAEIRPGWFTPTDEPNRLRFWRLDPKALGAVLGEDPPPILVIAERADPPQILGRTEAVTPALRDPHLSYALTWFALAGVLVVIYVLFGVTRARKALEVP